MKKKSSFISTLIICLVLLIIPIVIGVIISLSLGNFLYLEALLALFGLIELLVFSTNGRRRDNKIFKKTKSIYEDKSSKEYKEFRMSQWMIFALGVLSILTSLIVFLIFNR